MKNVLLYIWQLPQNIVGLLFYLCLLPVEYITESEYCKVYKSNRMSGGITLGRYVFLSRLSAYNTKTIRHESIGHGKQSVWLGPLYLIVIGIPSLVWAGIFRFTNKNYYWFYTERWADKLAGIER